MAAAEATFSLQSTWFLSNGNIVVENSHPLNVMLLSHIPPLHPSVFYSVRMLQKHPVTHITILCSLQLTILFHRHVSWQTILE
ncbi:unnamed protein product [Urochloa humidicola]